MYQKAFGSIGLQALEVWVQRILEQSGWKNEALSPSAQKQMGITDDLQAVYFWAVKEDIGLFIKLGLPHDTPRSEANYLILAKFQLSWPTMVRSGAKYLPPGHALAFHGYGIPADPAVPFWKVYHADSIVQLFDRYDQAAQVGKWPQLFRPIAIGT